MSLILIENKTTEKTFVVLYNCNIARCLRYQQMVCKIVNRGGVAFWYTHREIHRYRICPPLRSEKRTNRSQNVGHEGIYRPKDIHSTGCDQIIWCRNPLRKGGISANFCWFLDAKKPAWWATLLLKSVRKKKLESCIIWH